MALSVNHLKRRPNSKASLAKLPEEAGVYIFFKESAPIYVGKAINLKNRLTSYFVLNLAPKTARMRAEATQIAFIEVASELDALLLEAKLVHDLKPQYNAALKDDKHPLYIRVTNELYPRVLTARKIEEGEKNLAFYGPFPSSFSVRSVLKILRRIFPYSEHKLGSRPCLYSHLGLCDPCPNFIEKLKTNSERLEQRKKYLRNIRQIRRVLDRKTDSVLKELYKQMDLLSKEENFEEAKVVRDQIKHIEYISQPILPSEGFLENPNLLEDLRNEELKDLEKILVNCKLKIENLHRIECFDVAHLAGSAQTASMVTFIDGEPDKNFYRHFRLRQPKRANDVAALNEVINRRLKYLKKWGKPDLVIVDGGRGQVSTFVKALFAKGILVVGLAKQFETLVIPKNGGFVSIQLKESPAKRLVQRLRDEAHRFARRYHHHLLKKALLDRAA